MALALSVNGLDGECVRVISPANPEFDDLARPLMGERVAHIGLQLKPMHGAPDLVRENRQGLAFAVALSPAARGGAGLRGCAART